jgi:hypothetical protein
MVLDSGALVLAPSSSGLDSRPLRAAVTDQATTLELLKRRTMFRAALLFFEIAETAAAE